MRGWPNGGHLLRGGDSTLGHRNKDHLNQDRLN